MGYQALNFRLQTNGAFKMPRMHACLQNVQHTESPRPAPEWPEGRSFVLPSTRVATSYSVLSNMS